MTYPISESWIHTAIIVASPSGEIPTTSWAVLNAAAATVLASPEFDEVSFHVLVRSPGDAGGLPTSVDDVLGRVLDETEASAISLVWCEPADTVDGSLAPHLEPLNAVRFTAAVVEEVRQRSAAPDVVARRAVIAALTAAEGHRGTPRPLIEAFGHAQEPAPAPVSRDPVAGRDQASPLPSMPVEGGYATRSTAGEGYRDPGRSAERFSRADDRLPGRGPAFVQDVRTAFASQLDDWRSGTSKARRAAERVGVAEFDELRLMPGVRRPLLYVVVAASPQWDKRSMRTRDAALTLITRGLGRQWVVIAANMGATLSRVAGPTVPNLLPPAWRRTDRSNDFDLGHAAGEVSAQLSRDVASLRLRGHDVGSLHVVVFATEPPFVDSSADSAYRELLGAVDSVTWLLAGDSGWMETPWELEQPPSRVLQAEQDGAKIFLAEVLSPIDQEGED